MITKQVISIFTFGVFLIILGAILKLFKWPQANLLLAIGLVFEILAALLFIWKKIKQ
ncbi:MAG: gliding motility protein GldL [Lutibacter sp.]|uniref:GldL-related protein n=1 Tax=Lutibacter sp. TaxID=1925666 RepID=UPI0019EA8D94|nr:gliding motility protein GldL [Lutibacter sp.]NOR29255.1 gliding motility protein GldL [Lutibacter sp.]